MDALLEEAKCGNNHQLPQNFAEVIARMGAYPPIKTTPAVLGYEAAGIISAVGGDVEDFAVGGSDCSH